MSDSTIFNSKRPVWSSKIGFVLVGIGSAVGLGNIWRFPFMAGDNGGGAFVLIYFLSVLLIGLPILYAELMLGRKTRKGVIGSFLDLCGKKSGWNIVGFLGALTAFLIISYYSVVAGWVLFYLKESVTFGFSGQDPQQVGAIFSNLVENPIASVLWHALMMAICTGVLWRGVDKGIERLCIFAMPLLFVCLLVLDVVALLSPGAEAGLAFLLRPDFSKITSEVVLQAIGQALYSLSLGAGVMITYGSYIPRNNEFHRAGGLIAVFGSLIAILAGVAIFPIVFSYGFSPSGGPGLVFKTLPVIFAQMTGGAIFAIIFFSLLFFAALTSAISLLEVVVAFITDQFKWSRRTATIVVGSIVFVCGIPSALSSSLLSGLKIIGGRGIFSTLDYLCVNWLLLMGGLGLAIFSGWVLTERVRREEFCNGSTLSWLYYPWRGLLRYVVPLALAAVFFRGIGIF